MPVTAAMLLLVSPVTLYAADNTSVGEVPAKFNLERDSILEKPKMDGIQLTSEDIKGHWLAAEVEDFNAADFDSNGDCHITIDPLWWNAQHLTQEQIVEHCQNIGRQKSPCQFQMS